MSCDDVMALMDVPLGRDGGSPAQEWIVALLLLQHVALMLWRKAHDSGNDAEPANNRNCASLDFDYALSSVQEVPTSFF
jgi:hypothetical protein